MKKERGEKPFLSGIAPAVYDIIEMVAYTVAAVIVITLLFFRPTVVDGDSMQKTLNSDEYLLISDLFYTPSRGDIIVFDDLTIQDRNPGISSALVKRVIAVGGDTVAIRADGVYVNGEKLKEDYVYTNSLYRYKPMEEFTVPDGELFVMGDHRDDSMDSRSFHTVNEKAVLGHVILRVSPFGIVR